GRICGIGCYLSLHEKAAYHFNRSSDAIWLGRFLFRRARNEACMNDLTHVSVSNDRACNNARRAEGPPINAIQKTTSRLKYGSVLCLNLSFSFGSAGDPNSITAGIVGLWLKEKGGFLSNSRCPINKLRASTAFKSASKLDPCFHRSKLA